MMQIGQKNRKLCGSGTEGKEKKWLKVVVRVVF
jgi:hypothetical protein